MKTYERSWWWVKEKKQMALVFIIVTMMLQFQMKGCVGCLKTERMGLLQLKSYLNSLLTPEEASILGSWNNHTRNSECCLWERVKCSDAIGGHVVVLSLDQLMDWNTPRPFNISLLHSFPQLRNLDFSSNWCSHLFDPIHGYKSFQRLENLRTLKLSHNALNNSVLPFLTAARSLRILTLGYNSLGGVFPLNGLIKLRKLEVLDLSYNFINNFQAGDDLVLHSSLKVLNLQENQLSYTPKGYLEICRLMHLRELDLSKNALASMPYCLGNLTRLRTLDLSHNQLNGDLSSFVSGLPSALEYLSLLDNNFNGLFLFKSLVNQTRLTVFKLSSELGMIQAQAESSWVPLFQLQWLTLQNVSLGSTLPGFLVHQHDLRFIDLSHNKFAGKFPTWLVLNNARLQTLLLNNNLLTKLQLPRIPHGLQVLDISSNRIYDSVQRKIGLFFPNLRYMNFSSNHIYGAIPSSMGEMKSLETLDMSSNGLSGHLPNTLLSGCYSLMSLMLSNNQFQGEIFPEHANLTGLNWLALDGNNFNGSLGKGLLNSKDLFILDISNNSISAPLPLWIGRMSSLGYLFMRGNKLKGPFPRQLQNLHQLRVIDFSHNSLSGSIPRNFDFPSLTELRLQSNEFMGTIPDMLFEAGQLELLDLGNNKFSGKIMNSIGHSSSLRVLVLRNNSLQSHIPEKICQLSDVALLDLSHNKFRGAIPSCLGDMSFGSERYNVTRAFDTPFEAILFTQNWSYTSTFPFDDSVGYGYQVTPSTIVHFLMKRRYESYQGIILHNLCGLDLSSNELSGEILVEFGNLHRIISLDLSNNRITGSFPDSISKLKDLESLDLSNNKLYGNIPPQLAGLNSLGYFNVSYNNLSGEIPLKGHLLTFDEKSYVGNANLCGLPTKISCNPQRVPEPNVEKQPKEEEEEEEGDRVINMVWFYWSCGAVYITTLLALFAFLCIDSRWSREWFYRVELVIHHLHLFKDRFFCN